MSSEDDQIIADFVVESREHLADVENQLMAIEAAGADIDLDLVNEVFRAVHSIKGAAGFLGFSALGQLAHDLENVLNQIRNREFVPDSTATDVMLRAADTLRKMIEDINHSNDVDIAEHRAALQRILAEPSSADSVPQTGSTSPGGETTEPAVESVEHAAESVEPAVEPTEPVVAMPPVPSPATISDDISTAPSTPVETNIRVSVSVLDSLMNLAGELVLSRNQLLQAVGSKDNNNSSRTLDSVAARLDQITSELQEAIMQTRMQVIGTVLNKFPRVVRDLSNQLGKQCQLTVEGQDVELDKSIIEAIGDPLTHLVRNSVDHGIESPEDRVRAGKPAVGTVVLRAFHEAGKVNISIRDDGAGIDVAKLKAKAIARGLVTAEQANDMSDRETLRLIFHPGFSLAEKVTGVSGRGVGMDVVKTNIEKLGGAVEIDTQVGAGTTINIKLPLTLAIIPSLVVRCSGHRFAVPQASISELVLVKAGEVAAKIQRVKHAEVFRLRGNLLPLIRLDAVLGLVSPTETHNDTTDDTAADTTDESTAAGPVNIIVVETGNLQYGMIVDGLHDSEEIVVKPLGRHMQQCDCMAGATILGDGRVALILDVAGTASHSQLALSDTDDVNDVTDIVAAAGEEKQAMLLFTNHPDEQFGVPMELIARLERVRSDQIDSVGGQEVLQYRGVSLPLLNLENYIKAAPRPETQKIYVVVFNVLQREVGLIVPELIDIRDVSTDVDTLTLHEPGVIGSIVVDDKATRLMDLYELTQVAHPDWFDQSQSVPAHGISGNGDGKNGEEYHVPSILMVEDSGFFRTQLSGFLEDAGYEVTGCEDGVDAWNTLNEPGRRFDLVVTDIEMPNMNGFELSQKIKEDPALAHLPIIAVTSLAGEEDIERGERVGIDDYQIKLDREQLMASVARHLQGAGSPKEPAMIGG
jgi:two-component system chemotaxis sensor kinase CheA